MNFEKILENLYPINNKNNKIKKFIQNNFDKRTSSLYISELAIYMIAATKVSAATILEKIIYEQNIKCLSNDIEKQKDELYKDDIYFMLEEDEEVKGYYFLKANDEVIAVVTEDLELYNSLEKFILN